MAKDQKQTNNIAPEEEKRFKDLQELSTIDLAAPHQNILQDMIAKKVVEEIEGLAAVEKPIDILEIGTGEGLTTRKILEASDRVKIISTDNDEGMVLRAKNNLEEYVTDGRLEVRNEGALEFLRSFSDDSVYIIASGFTIHNFKNDYRKKVLEEIFRVLKSGGKFITGDKIMPDDKELFEKEVVWQNAQFENIPVSAERQKWLNHYEEDMASDIIMRESELIMTLEEIGFQDIKITNRHHLEALLTVSK